MGSGKMPGSPSTIELRTTDGTRPVVDRCGTVVRVEVARALGLFGLAGLAEIGGGWLVWRWLRDGAGWVLGLVGALVLVAYGVIPTLRRETRSGGSTPPTAGCSSCSALLWGWWLDGDRPDRRDIVGALVVSVGVGIIFFGPAVRRFMKT